MATTAKSGYIQRKIVKVCEDVKVQYDGTVRDATGKIYQFAYGDNGFDSTKTVRVDGRPQFYDIGRLANKLNMCHELGLTWRKESDIEVDIVCKPIEPILKPKVRKPVSEKKELIDKIHQNYPDIIIDKKWSVYELRQRLASLDADSTEEDELEEEKEDIEEKEDEDAEEKEDEDDEEMFGGDEDDENGEYNEPDCDDGGVSDFEDE